MTTLPEWVDPSSPDDPRAGGANDEGLPTPGTTDPVLATKPVLEWTHEDWARWVAGSTADPSAGLRPAAEEKAAPPGEAVEVEAVELEEEAAGAGEGEWADGPDTPIVDIRLPEEDGFGPAAGGEGEGDGDGEGPWWDPPLALLADEDEAAGASPAITLGPDGWSDPGPAQVEDPVPDRAWDEPPELAVVAPAAADGSSVDEAERPWEEPPELAAVAPAADGSSVDEAERPGDEPPELAPVHEDRPWDDEEEFERRAAVWAEQQPPMPQGRMFQAVAADTAAGALAEESDEAVEVWPGWREAEIPAGPPAQDTTGQLAPPPLTWPPEDVGPPPRREESLPRSAVATRPVPAGRVVDDESHRFRSAVGLLMLAVTLGVILAALITGLVLAIGFALRQLSA